MNPYREPWTPDHVTEMQEAVALMWRWRRYRPAIAGGSLWAWAAGHKARDVDIFMLSTYTSRWKLQKIYGDPAGAKMGEKVDNSGYERISSAYDITVHKTYLPGGTPVDLILCPWGEGEVVNHFDYAHCAVAFGTRARIMGGVAWYTAGDLLKKHDKARPEDVIRAKIQADLWGSEQAPAALAGVFSTLEKLLAPYLDGWVED